MNRKFAFPLFSVAVFVAMAISPANQIQAQAVAWNEERSALAQSTIYEEDFEDGRAQGWELEEGWQVILDGINHVLSGQGHHWARSNQAFEDDYRLSFRLKLMRGTIHMVYRLNDVGRYYIGLTFDGSYLGKQIWPDEFHDDLVSHSARHALNTWHQIEIIGQGNVLTLYVNGAREWTYSDAQPLLNGSFAFETLENSQAYIDDILVTMGSAPSPAPREGSPTAPSPSAAELAWIRSGGPLGGLGYDVRMRPDNPDRMFVTDAWAGVFASDDGGQNWYPANEGITTRTGPTGEAIPVFSLTIDPNNPQIVWAGTQFLRGIFKSTDGGRTWQKMNSGVIEKEGISFRGFTVQPGNSDIVYAAAELSSWAWTADRQPRSGREFDLTAGVIYKTTNGGQSWRAVWRGNNLARYIWINPQDTNIIYISTGIFDREAANSDPVAGTPGGEGVLKSTDGGATWTHVNNGLGNLYVGSLFMHPSNPQILLAGTGSVQYQEGGGVYLSTDGGLTWKQTLSSIFTEAVEFAVSDPEIAYAGDAYGIYRSEDGGQTWKLVSGNKEPNNRFGWGSPGVRGGHPIDFQVDPRDPDRIYINAYGGGVFLSEDGGRTWMDASKGYTGALTRDIVVDPSEPGRVIAAARSGIFASHNGGNDWEGLNYPELFSSEWEAVAIDPNDPQHLLASNNWTNALAQSTNGGHTWRIVKDLDGKVGWRSIAFAPSNPAIAYAGSAGYFSAGAFDQRVPGRGIYVSRNGGRTWSAANDSSTRDAHVASLAIHPGNPDIVYAATSNHGLLKTTDGGTSWTLIRSGLPASGAILVAINPLDANIILAGFDRGAIYRSIDGGQSWTRSASGLNPEATIADIVFDPLNPETIYLADLFSGVYRSTNGGRTWMAINNELLSRSVNALALSRDGLHLYAATEGAGVFRLDLNGRAPQPAPTPASSPSPSPSHSASATPRQVVSPMPTVYSPGQPSATPTGGPGICGGAAILPLVVLGAASREIIRRRSR
jgi:photosystem II stability/assembly factor-like uncharacterized protein